MRADKKLILTVIAQNFSTSVIILLFLNGKIIDYPRGTHEGGIIAAVGVLVIIAVMSGVSILFLKFGIIERNKNSSNNG
jgi:hypothetical protein